MNTLSDDELNQLVAEMVAGWIHLQARHISPSGWTAEIDSWVDEHGRHQELPPYATSSDAVLPLLEKAFAIVEWRPGKQLGYLKHGGRNMDWEVGPTFTRCACLALLKAAGVEVAT